MSVIDSMRGELRALDEQKSDLETQRNSLELKGKNDIHAQNDIRGIDAMINAIDKNMTRLVEQIEDAGG